MICECYHHTDFRLTTTNEELTLKERELKRLNTSREDETAQMKKQYNNMKREYERYYLLFYYDMCFKVNLIQNVIDSNSNIFSRQHILVLCTSHDVYNVYDCLSSFCKPARGLGGSVDLVFRYIPKGDQCREQALGKRDSRVTSRPFIDSKSFTYMSSSHICLACKRIITIWTTGTSN